MKGLGITPSHPQPWSEYVKYSNELLAYAQDAKLTLKRRDGKDADGPRQGYALEYEAHIKFEDQPEPVHIWKEVTFWDTLETDPYLDGLKALHSCMLFEFEPAAIESRKLAAEQRAKLVEDQASEIIQDVLAGK